MIQHVHERALASGAARERSESLLQPLLFAWLGVAALLARNLLLG